MTIIYSVINLDSNCADGDCSTGKFYRILRKLETKIFESEEKLSVD